MAVIIDTPKLLPIRIDSLATLDMKNSYVYTYTATIDVTAQMHSGTTGFVAKQYDGRDVRVGDYIATTGRGKILKISSITNVGPTRIVCTLMDEDQMNAAVDPTQFGESSIDADNGILFELREGKPYLFPLPEILPGGLTNEFATQILSRFNFVSKEKNINVEQLPHTFELGETVTLTSSGWITDTTDPTGVVVVKDDDSFGVRLFGAKTSMQLPGAIGDVYYWDPTDRMLTKTPGAGSVKLFQKLDSTEALLLDTSTSAANPADPGHFSGSYTDLTNKPAIPTDTNQLTNGAGFATEAYVTTSIAGLNGGGEVDLSGYVTTGELTTAISAIVHPVDLSDLTDTTNLLSAGGVTSYDDLTNKPSIPSIVGLATTAEVATAVAAVDLAPYATTASVNTAIAGINTFSGAWADVTGKPALFTGNYDDLYNKPTFPSDLGDLTNNAGYLTAITGAHVNTALGYTPQNAATAFSGDYNALINKPAIPDTSTFISEASIDAKIATAIAGEGVDLAGYVTDAELATAIAAVDLSSYATIASLSTAIAAIVHPTTDLSTYSTTTQVQALIDAIPGGGVTDYNNLTNKPTIPSIAGLTTTAELNTAIAAIVHPTTDLSTYSTTTQIQALIDAIPATDLAAYATTASVNTAIAAIDLSSYATTTALTTAIANVNNGNGATTLSQLSNVSDTIPQAGYVLKWNGTEWAPALDATAGEGGSGYATTSYVDQKLLERGHHFSGDYNALTNLPVLFSGDYNDLLNKPATASDLELQLSGAALSLVDTAPSPNTTLSTINLAALTSSLNYADLSNKPNLFSGDYNDLVNRPALFSGDYNDLSNKPYIPSIAGYATEAYVNTKHAEADITGNKNFAGDLEFRQDIKQKLSTVDTTAERKNLVMAIQTTDTTLTEVLQSDATAIALPVDSTCMVEVHVIGAASIGNYAVKIKGIVHTTASGSLLVGSTNVETLAEYSTWAANVDVNLSNLKITVAGSAATTVDWTVFCEIFTVIR